MRILLLTTLLTGCTYAPITIRVLPETKPIMSSWLVACVGIVYTLVAIDQTFKGNLPMSIMWGGYAFAQIGLWMMTK